MPRWYKAPSKIHGEGVFASEFIPKNDSVDFLVDGFSAGGMVDTRTELGKYINHRSDPNGRMEKVPSTNIYHLRSLKDIDAGSELTMDYNDTPSFVAKPHDLDPDDFKSWG